MTTPSDLDLRRGADRGTTDLGWLRSRHSFSFGAYRDPARRGFRGLRVLNDDVVAPGGGFGEHGHADMEIVSWVLSGGLAHRDSTGEAGVIRPGDLQVMSAGRGIRHAEMNASAAKPVHFLQIWIEPRARGVAPSYRQRSFPAEGRRDCWQCVASAEERDDALRLEPDASIRVAELAEGRTLEVPRAASRFAYLHVALGAVRLGATTLASGDAVALDPEAGEARTLPPLVAERASSLLLLELA